MRRSWRPWTQRWPTGTEGGEETIVWETVRAPAGLMWKLRWLSMHTPYLVRSLLLTHSHDGSGMIFFVSTSKSPSFCSSLVRFLQAEDQLRRHERSQHGRVGRLFGLHT